MFSTEPTAPIPQQSEVVNVHKIPINVCPCKIAKWLDSISIDKN